MLHPALQHFPGVLRQIFREFIELGHGVDAKDKPHARGVPAVEVLGLREVGVAAQEDAAKARSPAVRDGPIEITGGLLVAGPIARAIHHVQRLARVGQGKHENMITPLALVVDVHALFALARGLDHRAVAVQHSLLKEALRLLTPNLHAGLVEHLLQAADVRGGEAAAEVARRGGVGNAPGAQRVEVAFVVAQEFQVFQARAARQEIVGDVQHMVRFVVGQMDLQHLQAVVDRLVEPQLPHQQVHGTHAAGSNRSRALGDLVVDVGGRHHRPRTPPIVLFVQPPGDPGLALFDLFSYLGVHSKILRAAGKGIGQLPLNP